MNNIYKLSIQTSISLEEAWSEIEKVDIEILWASEEEDHLEMVISLPQIKILPAYPWIKSCDPFKLPPIDWETQWALHSPHFREGIMNLDLGVYHRQASPLQLIPGPGFGNLSHPTTRLMIELLSTHLQQEVVIDIGSGSGILTLAAAALGSSKAYGIEIDQHALDHSIRNAKQNGWTERCVFCHPNEFFWKVIQNPIFILMNMIYSEQQIAWASLSQLHRQSGMILTSGIRAEEKEAYLIQAKKWNWLLKEERQEMEWWAFCFEKK